MDRVKVKEIILGFLTIVVTVGSFWLLFQSISLVASGDFKTFGLSISAVIGLIFAGALFSLLALFVDDWRIRFTSVAISIGVPYFFVSATIFVIVAFFMSILLVIFGAHRIYQEYSLSVGFGVAKTLKTGLPLFFTSAALIVSIFYFANLDRERVVESLFPEPAFVVITQFLARPLESLTGLSLSNPNATIDDIATDFVENQLESQGILPTSLVQSELTKLVGVERDQLSQLLGITLSGEESISEVFYNSIAIRLKDLFGPYAVYLPAVSAIAFFFAFKALTIPLYFITLLVVWILVYVLERTHVLSREKHNVEVERLIL
jgi:hypothetical protein